jgi:hypothetical protein
MAGCHGSSLNKPTVMTWYRTYYWWSCGDYQYTQGVSDNAYGNFGSLAAQNQPTEDAHKYRALLEGLNGSAIDMTNTRPTISDMPGRYVVAGESLTVDFNVADAETAVTDLTIMVDSSESLHVPNSNIAVTGTGSDRLQGLPLH